MTTSVTRPGRSRTDDIFFTCMSLVMLATVLYGFAHSYFLAGMVRAPLPSLLVHVHGAAFTAWILLFLVQTVLIGAGKVRLHRTLGWVGTFLAGTMLVLGIVATCAAVRRGVVPPGFVLPQFFVLNNLEVILFAALVAWGVAIRYNRPAHKRLMLLATLALMGPAISRFPIVQTRPQLIPLIYFAELLTVLVFDLVTRHKPYLQTVVGTLCIFALLPIATALGKTALVLRLVGWVLRG